MPVLYRRYLSQHNRREKIFIESLRFAVAVYTLKCQCFTEDTLVSTIDGDRPIGELEAGDKVWAYNTETGENEEKAITAVIVTETDVIVHVKTSDGEDIETTMFHPFYVRHSDKESGGSVYDGEWKAASNLLAGDVLQKIDGSTVYVTEVTVEKLPEIINVYNLEIEDLHTYYVADGVLVHNQYETNGSQSDSETSYGKSSGKYDTTADFLTNIENRNGKFYTDKATIDKIGQVEARGEDFSLLNKRIMSSRASTEGGTSVVYKYSDELGTKYLIHEVTDARGYIIHRDFDAVRISSGQLINKGH